MKEERIWTVNDEKLKEMLQDFFPASVFDTEFLFCNFSIALKEKKIKKPVSMTEENCLGIQQLFFFLFYYFFVFFKAISDY